MFRKRKENVSSSGQSLGLKGVYAFDESLQIITHILISYCCNPLLSQSRASIAGDVVGAARPSAASQRLSLACFDNISSTQSPNCTSIRSHLRLTASHPHQSPPLCFNLCKFCRKNPIRPGPPVSGLSHPHPLPINPPKSFDRASVPQLEL